MKNSNFSKYILALFLVLGVSDIENYVGFPLYDEQKYVLLILTSLAIAFSRFQIPLLCCGLAFFFSFPYLAEYANYEKTLIYSFAFPLCLLVLVGSINTCGKSFTFLLLSFLLIPLVYNGTGQPYFDILSFIVIDNTAMLGMVMSIITGIVFLFIALGVFLLNTGSVDIIIQYILRYIKSPARIAIASSAVFGSISGSAVANVMSTGQVTIPLMIKCGYPKRLAGAYEAVASTGGQLLPPIMGAAAFLMAELLMISYWTVVLYATIPALCFYGLLLIKAPKGRVETQPTKVKLHLPNFKKSILQIVDSMYGMIILGAGIGLMIGIMDQTGMIYLITGVLSELSVGSPIALLIMTAVLCIILGMGMPTGAAYLVVAIITTPSLIEVGFAEIWAHMFVLYFATLSMITPPVAIAAFAAAKMTDTNPITTSLTSMYIAWPLYVLPFIFVWF
jgi:TRAP-type uncharacterized transport system fused permease subunit